MKTYALFLLAGLCLHWPDAAGQSKSKSKKHLSKPGAKTVTRTAAEETLLGKIATGNMTVKIHRMLEVYLDPCEKCLGSNLKFQPKPHHRVVLFEISRRNANSYELNAQLESATPLYARIIGTDGLEYACHNVPSLVEIAMAQKKGIDEKNAKAYFQLLVSAPPRSDHRAFALAAEMPVDVQPRELVWRKELRLQCPLNMGNNKAAAQIPAVAGKTRPPHKPA